MKYSGFRKFFLSICFAFLFIAYIPVACLVGNDTEDKNNIALAETEAFEEETTEEIIEFQDASVQ